MSFTYIRPSMLYPEPLDPVQSYCPFSQPSLTPSLDPSPHPLVLPLIPSLYPQSLAQSAAALFDILLYSHTMVSTFHSTHLAAMLSCHTMSQHISHDIRCMCGITSSDNHCIVHNMTLSDNNAHLPSGRPLNIILRTHRTPPRLAIMGETSILMQGDNMHYQNYLDTIYMGDFHGHR